MEFVKDGRAWRIGGAADVGALAGYSDMGHPIAAAIPPVFEAYGTFHLPDGADVHAHERAVVLVEAGPEQALAWRTGHMRGEGALPDLFFPADRSWLVSALWDDGWACVGGPEAVIDALVADGAVNARRVRPGEDALPPGLVRE